MNTDSFEILIVQETPDAYWSAVLQSGILVEYSPARQAEIQQKIWAAFAPETEKLTMMR